MQENPKANKILSIILREIGKWTAVSKLINENGIRYNKAKNIELGTEVIPNTEEDYKNLHKLLQKEHPQFHTFELKSEKLLTVALRGLPTEITIDKVEQNLKQKSI